MAPLSDPATVRRSIDQVGFYLTKIGLVDATLSAKVVRFRDKDIVTQANPVNSTALKDVDYMSLYFEQLEAQSYNVRFLDGALAQLTYSFKGRRLVHHRLAYLPSPALMGFMEDPDAYNSEWSFANVMGSQATAVALRFDFDPEHAIAVDHPASHLTLGQYQHCRIPVSGPLTPVHFFNFVVHNFYLHPQDSRPHAELAIESSGVSPTILLSEQDRLHIRIP